MVYFILTQDKNTFEVNLRFGTSEINHGHDEVIAFIGAKMDQKEEITKRVEVFNDVVKNHFTYKHYSFWIGSCFSGCPFINMKATIFPIKN